MSYVRIIRVYGQQEIARNANDFTRVHVVIIIIDYTDGFILFRRGKHAQTSRCNDRLLEYIHLISVYQTIFSELVVLKSFFEMYFLKFFLTHTIPQRFRVFHLFCYYHSKEMLTFDFPKTTAVFNFRDAFGLN